MKTNSTSSTFAATYPHIAFLISGGGWIEMGQDHYSSSFVRALDLGGMVWEGESSYATIDDALQALDAGIAVWMEENGL
jgi:hypothetical protein